MQIAEFVLENNFFEFNNQIKQQISGIAVGTMESSPQEDGGTLLLGLWGP